jgi:hypothetical protein
MFGTCASGPTPSGRPRRDAPKIGAHTSPPNSSSPREPSSAHDRYETDARRRSKAMKGKDAQVVRGILRRSALVAAMQFSNRSASV